MILTHAAFPRTSMEDRGLFALGYYQQMQVFFAKKADVVAED